MMNSIIEQERRPEVVERSRETETEWTTRITPHGGYFDWRLGQLRRYHDLIWMFVWRDFVSAYKQTILGPTWHVIQPLLTTLMFTVIFSKIARLSTNGAPAFLFYLIGIVTWSYFASNLSKTATTFVGNAHLLGKVYFHRLVIPISTTISSLVTFGIQFGIFLVFLICHWVSIGKVELNGAVAAVPIFILMLSGYSLGGGIIVSALTTRYRDLANLIGFGVQLLMYATPVIYPVSMVPEKFRWLVEINPLTPVIEGFRVAFLSAGTLDLPHLAISFALMVALLAAGLMLFTHVERTFMDTV